MKRYGIKPSFKGHKHSEETKKKNWFNKYRQNKNAQVFKFSEKSKKKNENYLILDNQKGEK